MTYSALKNDKLLEFEAVSKIFGKGQVAMHALDKIHLSVSRGEFVAIMGHSGSGKSTCMNILGCLDTPTSGVYRFDGVDVTRLTQDQRSLLRRHFIGFVFQSFSLLKRTSALENVELPLTYRKVPAKIRRKKALAALVMVGLENWAQHTPSELSGGQQQRVAIARAMVTNPRVLLADEPTGNLDTTCSREVMDLLVKVNREQKITILMVTHEAEMAVYASRQIQFKDGHIIS
ncbi:MAG: ABC transporter ATP-binding protein [Desulfobacteraceae bacterium]